MYFTGDGVSKDYLKAKYYFEEAKRHGLDLVDDKIEQVNKYIEKEKSSPEASKTSYETVPGNIRDLSIDEIKAKAEAGNADAMAEYAAALGSGSLGLKCDAKESVVWFKKAALKGSGDGASGLGWAYFNGEGVAQDYKEAAKWFLIAAEKGDPIAQERMGYLYSKGLGVAHDVSASFSWYKKSAEQGNEGGICGLGLCYLNGEGVDKNIMEAMKLFKDAAERGDPIGQDLYKAASKDQRN
jgi:uncharacterized protein